MARRKKNSSKLPYIILVILVVFIGLALVAAYQSGMVFKLKPASISPTCDFTIMSISDIKTISNEPTLNYEKAYLITVRADKGSECIQATLTQDDLQKFGISEVMLTNITISAQLQDMSLDYKVYDDTILYKIYESTASADLSGDIPYDKTSLETTQLSAVGKFSDPNMQAPKINHLGNFPSGGDPNLMLDVGEWAYVMPEASSIPLGADKSGNWWVTHMGGIPYYRGYLIDTMAFNKYKVLFTITRESELLASATMDEQNRIAALGNIATIEAIGSKIESVFPPQPGVNYALVQGLDGTPVDDRWKFVSKYRYDYYKANLDSLVNYDNNYFAYSWSDMSGTLNVNSTPVGVDVYLDNKYLGFTPLTIKDIPIGRHTLTARKTGYYDASQEINLMPTQNRYNVQMAKIPPPEIIISITPQTITQGQPATLKWSVSGEINLVKLMGPEIKTVESTGTRTVSPQESTTYTIIASGPGGEKMGSVRLSVSPPPPPQPSPPVSRDPGVGREGLTIYENNLNNMLGLMAAESVAPADCIFDKNAIVVTCRPQFPVTYPEFRILLKAKYVAIQINSGIPEITSTEVAKAIEGQQSYITVNFRNAGKVSDSFDLSLQSKPSLSGGVKTFTLPPNASASATIPFSGAMGTYEATIILQSKNNPLAKATKKISITIEENPLPTEIKRLEKQTDILEDLVMKGLSKIITILIIGILGIVVILSAVVLKSRRKKYRTK